MRTRIRKHKGVFHVEAFAQPLLRGEKDGKERWMPLNREFRYYHPNLDNPPGYAATFDSLKKAKAFIDIHTGKEEFIYYPKK